LLYGIMTSFTVVSGHPLQVGIEYLSLEEGERFRGE